MDTLLIEGSSKTPLIDFNGIEGKLLLEGRSIPENSLDFYRPIMEWLDNYIAQPANKTTININRDQYLSTY
jgi:hypothetical protein